MEENTDGDYDVPYLFLMNPKDTLQYIITFPIRKPYTYELCTARFAWYSQNKIATKIFDAIRRLNLDTIVQKNEKYNYIWLVITSLEDASDPIERWHKLSLLIKFEGVKPNLCLVTTDVNTIQNPENIWSWYDLHSVLNNDNNTFDFDVLSDSIESRQVAYAMEKGDSVLMYDNLCNTWALDQFQSEWTQRSNTRAGCWHHLATRIFFTDKKVHCIDFEYIK